VAGYAFLGADFVEFVMDLGGGSGTPPTAIISNNNQPVHCGTQITLDGSQSTASDNGSLTYAWTEGNVGLGTSAILTASLPGGTNLVTLTVTDSCGDSGSANTTVIVIDHGHPTITAPKNITSSTDANCQAVVPDVTGQVSVTDSCTPASLLTITQ